MKKTKTIYSIGAVPVLTGEAAARFEDICDYNAEHLAASQYSEDRKECVKQILRRKNNYETLYCLEVYSKDSDEGIIHQIGEMYFMSLEDAETQIRKNKWESVFCFRVDMIPVGEDTFLEDHITRCYLPNGELLTQTPPQINRIGGKVRFSGRIPRSGMLGPSG